MVHARRRLNIEDETDDDVMFVMANSKLTEKKRTPIEQVLDDNGDIERLDVDDLD
ncbi:hypothetical protein A2U01_0060637, partial [Trifolium medium]|nr:hypothetical protein [Trifolium medium]